MAYVSTHAGRESGVAAAGSALGRIGAAVRRITLELQVSRMRGVLEAMADRELDDIGVRRDQIDTFARRAVTGR